jgi:hypothetical protein
MFSGNLQSNTYRGVGMGVHFVKSDYRFTYFDGCHEKHIFDFIQYTDNAAIQTVHELFLNTEVTPVSLYNIAKGIIVFDENS